jgi:hypothetical protein
MVLVVVWHNKSVLLAGRAVGDLRQPHPYFVPTLPFIV